MPFRMQSTEMPRLASAYAGAVPNLAQFGITQQANERERVRTAIREFGENQARKREERRAEEGGGGWLGTGIGAIIGGIVGAVLAPFTGGASLGLLGGAGGIAGTVGTSAAVGAGAGVAAGAAGGAAVGAGIGGPIGEAIKPPGGPAGAYKSGQRQQAIQSLAPFLGGALGSFQAPKGQRGAAFQESVSPYLQKYGLELGPLASFGGVNQ